MAGEESRGVGEANIRLIVIVSDATNEHAISQQMWRDLDRHYLSDLEDELEWELNQVIWGP